MTATVAAGMALQCALSAGPAVLVLLVHALAVALTLKTPTENQNAQGAGRELGL